MLHRSRVNPRSREVLDKKERERPMATTNNESKVPQDVTMLATLAQAISTIANDIALPVLSGQYFNIDNHASISKELRKLQELVGGIVTEHDKLADATGNARLVGKRGRTAGDAKVPTTVDDVVKRLTKTK